MVKRSRWALCGTVLWAMLLAGCQAAAPGLATIPQLQGVDTATLPHRLPGTTLDVERFTSPDRLAGLAADGVISRQEGGGWKQWRYRDRDTLLKVTIYGLPGGWASLSAERIVAGHYSQLRQRRVDRVLDGADRQLDFVAERLSDLNGHTTVISRMRVNAPDRQPLYEVLLLTLDDQHYVRLELASRTLHSEQLATRAKMALVEFRQAQEADADKRVPSRR